MARKSTWTWSDEARAAAQARRSAPQKSSEFAHVNVKKLRAARAYLHWTLDEAEAQSGVDRITIYRAEKEILKTKVDTLRRLIESYAEHGVTFTKEGLGLKEDISDEEAAQSAPASRTAESRKTQLRKRRSSGS
jgi:DNA-binding XRE family transcriptional regulator